MATDLQYSPFLFTNFLNHNCDVATVVLKSQETWVGFKTSFPEILSRIGSDHLQRSMDKLIEQNNREHVRNVMLRQEEIFKQQVRELHRLHRVQKSLMAELRIKEANFHSVASANTPAAVKDTRSRPWSSTSTSETSQSCHRPTLSSYHINPEHDSIHQYDAEEYPRKQRGFDLEQPVEEETSHSLDCSKEGRNDEECNVELTLNIGCGSGKKKSKHWPRPERSPSNTRQMLRSTTPVRTERGEECSERESLQRPPWLFQAMSLN